MQKKGFELDCELSPQRKAAFTDFVKVVFENAIVVTDEEAAAVTKQYCSILGFALGVLPKKISRPSPVLA